MLKFFLFIILMLFCISKKWIMHFFFFFLMSMLIMDLKMNMYMYNVSMGMGLDMYSLSLIMLSLWIIELMVMASKMIFKFNLGKEEFLMIMVFMLLILFISFSVYNLFFYYLFFESSLLPAVLLILGWGGYPERLQACFYLLFYTLFMSLPLLICIFYLYKKFYSVTYFFLFEFSNNLMLQLGLMIAFLIKMPIFLGHLWLTKAHVEAPIAGSMILAGILLKLGGYGLIRILYFLKLSNLINNIFMMISLVGSVLISLICLFQTDLKILIAYSSVVHMGLGIGGILTLSNWGILGVMMMLIAHGLGSSGLFSLANLIYEQTLTRSMLINRGLLSLFPSMSMWWFLLCIFNMAAPPSLNLLSEICLLNSMVSWSWLLIMLLSLISFFSAGYSLYLYSYTQHNMIYSANYIYYNLKISDYLLIILHALPLSLLIFQINIFMFFMFKS